MIIRALVYSDLQATDGAERCYNNPAMPLQRYRVNLFFQKIRQIYHDRGCNALWDLGDTTDDRTAIPIPALKELISGLSAFPHESRHHNIKLIGNHEQYSRNAEIDAGGIFQHFFSVVRVCSIIPLNDNVNIVASPFPADTADAKAQICAALANIPPTTKIIFLGHHEVTGGRFKNGVQTDGVPLDTLDRVSVGLLGHIHLPQQLGRRPIHYVGSPFQQDFGEAGETKRVALVTIDGPNIQLEWITLDGFPCYRYVSLKDFETNFQPGEEHRYRVRLTSPTEAERFYQHPYSNRATIEYEYEIAQAEEGGTNSIELTARDWSLQAAAQRWFNHRPLNAAQITLTEQEMLEFGKQLVQPSLTPSVA